MTAAVLPQPHMSNHGALPPVGHNRPIPKANHPIGHSLCVGMKKVATIAARLQAVASELNKNKAGYTSAAVNIGTGLTTMGAGAWNGSIWSVLTGGGMTAAGAAYLLRNYFGDKALDLRELLESAQGGTSMLRVLEESNEKSRKVVVSNLKAVQKGVASLNARMGEIQALAEEDNSRVAQLKAEADELFQVARSLFDDAQEYFETSGDEISLANTMFSSALTGLDEIITLAHSEEGSLEERVAQFVSKSKEICSYCVCGQEALEKANDMIAKGMAALTEARDEQDKASVLVGQALESVETNSRLIQALAQKDEQCENRLGTMEKELNHMGALNKDKMEVLDNTQRDLQNAQEQLTENWGTMSMIGGFLGTALTTVPAILAGGAALCSGVGTIPTAIALLSAAASPIAAGFGAGKAVHERKNIFRSLSNRIYGEPKPKTAEDFKELAPYTDKVLIALDKRSTGVVGSLLGNESKTAGDVLFKLSASACLNLRFKLDKPEPISIPDMVSLQNTMVEEITEGRLDPEECLKIIRALQTAKVCGKKTLVKADSPYFRGVVRICDEKIAEREGQRSGKRRAPV